MIVTLRLTLPMIQPTFSPEITSSCVLCGTPFGDANDSDEHIIPSAIGGHHTVRSFICLECNNNKGNTWDAELAAQLNWFSVVLNIRRERGAPPRQKLTTLSGKGYWLKAGGAMESAEPPVRKEKTDSGHRYSFSLPSMEVARTKVLELAARYPQFDPDAILASATTQIQFIEEPVGVNLQLTEGSLRSIVKATCAMAYDAGVGPSGYELALQYLRNEEGQPVWSAFYDRDLVQNRPARQITHAVSVFADPVSRVALGYVEYFSAFRYVVRLSDQYTGPPVKKTIAFDPVTWAPVNLQIDLALSAEESGRCLNGDTWSFESAQRAFDYSLPIALQSLDKRQFNNAIRQAIVDGFEAMGVAPNGQLPSEKLQDFSAFVSQRAAQYLFRSPRPLNLMPRGNLFEIGVPNPAGGRKPQELP